MSAINRIYTDDSVSFLQQLALSPLTRLMIIVLGLSLLGQPGAIMAWVVVAVWTMQGPDEAIEGILLSLLLVLLNRGIFSVLSLATTARWIILGLAFVRIIPTQLLNNRTLPKDKRQNWPIWIKANIAFVIVMSLFSFLVSPAITVSIFKLTTYLIGTTVIGIGIMLGQKRNWLLSIINYGTVIAIASLPLVALPVGYLRNAEDFQGILVHPQTYGVTIMLPLAVAGIHFLFESGHRIRLSEVIVITMMIVTVYMSATRTAYFAFIIALAIGLLMFRDNTSIIWRLAFNPLTYLTGAAIIVGLWYQSPQTILQDFFLQQNVLEFNYEELPINEFAGTLARSTYSSREALVSLSWENFLQNPVVGIGFGIPSTFANAAQLKTLFGIPIGFSLEKGMLATAVLEEIGLLGAFLFVIVLATQFRLLRHLRQYSLWVLFLTAFLINFGEMVYFAIGGLGAMVHICFALVLDEARNTIDAKEGEDIQPKEGSNAHRVSQSLA